MLCPIHGHFQPLSPMNRTVALIAALASTSPAAWSQSQVLPNDVVAVTTDGFFYPSSNSPTPLVFAPATAFGGLSNLEAPTIEWAPPLTGAPADSFFVSTRTGLFLLTVTGIGAGAGFTVSDITPTGSPDLYGVDVNPGNGELYLLDKSVDMVHRYAPPFSLGMSPVSSLAVPAAASTLAFHSRAVPESVLVSANNKVHRIPVDGSASSVYFPVVGAISGLDANPQQQDENAVWYTKNQSDWASFGPLAWNLNATLACSPLGLAPRDVEWSPSGNRAFVFAEDGLKNDGNCWLAPTLALGPNHIVSIGFTATPQLHTYNGGFSGITGSEGDLAVVFPDFGTISSFGSSCSAGPVSYSPYLDCVEPVWTPTTTGLTLTITGAPANGFVQFFTGTQLVSGVSVAFCDLLVVDPLTVSFFTDATGSLSVPFTFPAVAAGDLFVQAVIKTPTITSTTQGLKFHVGP